MSDSQYTQPVAAGAPTDAGAVKTAAHEAEEVKATATEQAGHIAATAKEEAGNVAHETGTQVRELYAQAQHELKDQAAAQQRRAAEGLRTVSDELGAMASGSDASGVATDLVQQASSRLSSAATWLGDRDPGSLLTDVKNYARRHPGAFIAGAAIVGVVAGRLTRALASGDGASETSSSPGIPGVTPPSTPADVAANSAPTPAPAAPSPSAEETPLYAEAARGAGATDGR